MCKYVIIYAICVHRHLLLCISSIRVHPILLATVATRCVFDTLDKHLQLLHMHMHALCDRVAWCARVWLGYSCGLTWKMQGFTPHHWGFARLLASSGSSKAPPLSRGSMDTPGLAYPNRQVVPPSDVSPALPFRVGWLWPFQWSSSQRPVHSSCPHTSWERLLSSDTQLHMVHCLIVIWTLE